MCRWKQWRRGSWSDTCSFRRKRKIKTFALPGPQPICGEKRWNPCEGWRQIIRWIGADEDPVAVAVGIALTLSFEFIAADGGHGGHWLHAALGDDQARRGRKDEGNSKSFHWITLLSGLRTPKMEPYISKTAA